MERTRPQVVTFLYKQALKFSKMQIRECLGQLNVVISYAGNEVSPQGPDSSSSPLCGLNFFKATDDSACPEHKSLMLFC